MKLTKHKYFNLINFYYIFCAIYAILNLVVIPFSTISASIITNISTFYIIYIIILSITICLYLMTFKIDKYKYNFNDKIFNKKVTIKIRNCFVLIYLSLFLNLFILAVVSFIHFNIIDYEFWLMTLILIISLILFALISYFFVKKSWKY